MKIYHLTTLIFLFGSCSGSHDEKTIVKTETELKLNCADGDTCIQFIRTYYSDGSWVNAFYLEYPHYKTAVIYDSLGKFVSEMQVTVEDSILNTKEYDKFGNELRYIRDHQTKAIPDVIYEYDNTYNEIGDLIKQVQYDLNGEIKIIRKTYYDNSDYSKIEVTENNKGDTLSIEYFNENLLVKEQVFRPFKYFRYLNYDENDRLLTEDPKHERQLRSYYYYEDGLLDSMVVKYRVWGEMVPPDSSSNRVHEIVTYQYEFDKEGRPIKTIKSRVTEGEIIPTHLIITKY